MQVSPETKKLLNQIPTLLGDLAIAAIGLAFGLQKTADALQIEISQLEAPDLADNS